MALFQFNREFQVSSLPTHFPNVRVFNAINKKKVIYKALFVSVVLKILKERWLSESSFTPEQTEFH